MSGVLPTRKQLDQVDDLEVDCFHLHHAVNKHSEEITLNWRSVCEPIARHGRLRCHTHSQSKNLYTFFFFISFDYFKRAEQKKITIGGYVYIIYNLIK